MDIVLRATVLFLFLLVLTRVIGRREISRLEPLDLILLIVMGDLIQQGVTQNDFSVTGALIAVGTFAVLQVFVSYAGFRFQWLRPALNGRPVVVVEDGNLIERNVNRERLSLDEILEQARLQHISSLDEVRWAVLETNGQISFIRKT